MAIDTPEDNMTIEWPEWKQIIFSKGLGPLHALYTATKAALISFDERINNVESGTVAPGSIDTEELADKAIDSTKLNYFVSDEQTGTGEAQSIPHGLEVDEVAVEPSKVIVAFTSIGTDGATSTYTKGTVNVNVTATTGAKYRVIAFA